MRLFQRSLGLRFVWWTIFLCCMGFFVSFTSAKKQEKQLSYVAFGSYCGQCLINCETLYVATLLGNSSGFFRDTSSTWLTNGLDWRHLKPIEDRTASQIGFKLIQEIPQYFFELADTTHMYGCPGCADECALYLRYAYLNNKQPTEVYISFDIHNQPKIVRRLAKQMIETLSALEDFK